MIHKKQLILITSALLSSASTFTMEPIRTSPQKDRDNLRVSALIRSASPQTIPMHEHTKATEEFRAKARACRKEHFNWIVQAPLTIRCNLKNIQGLKEAFGNEDDETVNLLLCKESEFIRGIAWDDITAIPKVTNPHGKKQLQDAVTQPRLKREDIREHIAKTSLTIKQKKEDINELLNSLCTQKNLGSITADQFKSLLGITTQEMARHKACYTERVFEMREHVTEYKLYEMRMYLLALHGIYAALAESTE